MKNKGAGGLVGLMSGDALTDQKATAVTSLATILPAAYCAHEGRERDLFVGRRSRYLEAADGHAIASMGGGKL
jgi:hypothetical protein